MNTRYSRATWEKGGVFDYADFSPSTEEAFVIDEKSQKKIAKETDLLQSYANSPELWSRFFSRAAEEGEAEMNALGLTLNGHIQPVAGHLPVWLRVYKRAHPLTEALQNLCLVENINSTVNDNTTTTTF